MRTPTTTFRLYILSFFFLFALTCSVGLAQVAATPVGTWEIAIARTGSSAKETGTAFVTFSNNNTFAGYGITTLTFSVFALSGTWDVDASGKLVGNYTEDLNGTFINGSVIGKATTGKKLQLNIVASNGTFKLNG